MISQRVGDGDGVGDETAGDFADDWMLGVDLFAVEDACECLVLLIEVDCGVVFI